MIKFWPKKVSNFLAVGYFLLYYFLGTGVDGSKHCFEVVDRDCEARLLLNQLCGGTKKVLRTFFARALKPKSEVEIKLFELLISVSQHSGWLTVLEPFGSSSSLINCVGAGPRNRDCVYRFLSLGAVVDWNYSYLRYSYFLINWAGVLKRSCGPFLPEP